MGSASPVVGCAFSSNAWVARDRVVHRACLVASPESPDPPHRWEARGPGQFPSGCRGEKPWVRLPGRRPRLLLLCPLGHSLAHELIEDLKQLATSRPPWERGDPCGRGRPVV